jgi:hypothetical protein
LLKLAVSVFLIHPLFHPIQELFMDDEVESPMERLTEEIHEVAEHARETWLRWAAMLSALFAVMAAVSSLEAAHFANDAMLAQIHASDQWGYYQAKGIKGMLMESEENILKQLHKPAPADEARATRYHEEQQQIKEKAEELAHESEQLMKKHEVLSRAVTLCQIAISLVAIAALTKRRRFVLGSCLLAAAGGVFLAEGLLM